MRDRRQVAALYRTFLARFFENEISSNSRDMKSSFLWIIGILAAPGLLIPMSNLWRWTWLMLQGPDVFRRGILYDKMVYLSFSMAGVMLLAAVVWQALLVDRRDAIVLGGFPVRPRVIVLSKLAALVGYLSIVAGGMHVVASLMYSTFLATSMREFFLGIVGHFLSGALACLFAGLTVAALQAVILAVAGPKVFARVTAPAQLVLAATGLLLFLMFPLFGAAVLDFARGNERSAWVLWMPQMWFLGIYEVMIGHTVPIMPAMAWRALLFLGGVLAVLLAAYPFAYRRIAAAAMQGSPLGSRRSLASLALAALIRRLPVAVDTRGGIHFILLTAGRVARNKLILASALGCAVALTLPFILRWTAQTGVGAVPGRSHIAASFAFAMFGLAGLRMSYNVPSEPGAAWIFSTAVRPGRIGTSAARVTGVLLSSIPAAICLFIYAWFWGAVMAVSVSLTVLAFGCLISEIGLRNVDFVPFTRSYNSERGKLQARWPVYLVALVVFLQVLPAAVQALLLHGNYWFAPAALGGLTACLYYLHPPEPPLLVDADFENKPLALRLY